MSSDPPSRPERQAPAGAGCRDRAAPEAQERSRDLLNALSRVRYRAGLEVGCATGAMTGLLAARCAGLLAIDRSETALQAARDRHRGQPGLRFERLAAPREFPPGPFDLIVVPELVRCTAMEDVALLAARIAAALEPAGEAVLLASLGRTDTALSGDAAAEGFIAATARELQSLRAVRCRGYRMDVLARA